MNTLLSCSNHNHLSDAKLKYGTSISQVAQPTAHFTRRRTKRMRIKSWNANTKYKHEQSM
jgi:hypothetical protein